jgi:hypothetical protein
MTTVALCENCDDPAGCVERFREKAASVGLDVTLDGRLATLPGSVHLHLRPHGERTGVLEYTMDVRNRRSWLSWHENRYRPWVDEAVKGLTLD